MAEKLGVDNPWLLTENHAPGDPRDLVGQMIAENARDLDSLQGQLTRAALSAVELLEPICRGEIDSANRYGILEGVAPQIDVLAARRAAAYEQLTRSIAAFRRLVPDQGTARPSKPTRHGLSAEQEPSQNDDWAISGNRRLGALEAVEAASLRFHQSAVSGDIYLSDGRGQRPNLELWPETVRRLVADGLLHQDTSEGLYQPGQLLSLTPQGEAVLRDARTAPPRVSVALSRSSIAPHSVPAADPPTTPAVEPATTSTRSRRSPSA
ncbi:large ATP-binding protein [Streptomyces sp. NPDC050422]|uniref:large ATP-binding protein n=1 Tax=Streptomyces sp. NPDC050422 TaxID=3365614 RepID=UPI0037A22817